MTTTALLWWLVVGHAAGDFWLQSDTVAKCKNQRTNPMPAVPWYYWLGAHALMHGGIVALVTGSITLGVLETITHAGLDWMKCEGRTTIHEDQAWHLVCKGVWAMAPVLP